MLGSLCVLLFGLVSGATTYTIKVNLKEDGAVTSFVGDTWLDFRGHPNSGNGACIDVWYSGTVTVVDCCFWRCGSNDMGGGGLIYLASGRLNMTDCWIENCTCKFWGILTIIGGDSSKLDVTETRFIDCKTRGFDWGGSTGWRNASIVLVQEQTNPIDVSITRCEFSKCKICDWTTDKPPGKGTYDAVIKLQSVHTLEFTDNTFTWFPEDQQDNWRSTCLVECFFAQEDTDFVMERCYIQNTTFSKGLLQLEGIRSITYRDVDIADVQCGNEDAVVGFLPELASRKKDGVITLENCKFRVLTEGGERRTSTTGSFIAAQTQYEVAMKNCQFSKCHCRSPVFLDFEDVTTVTLDDCLFNNIQFNDTEGLVSLVATSQCGTAKFKNISFHLPAISAERAGLSFDFGSYEFYDCIFVVDGAEEKGQLKFTQVTSASFDGCQFNLSDINESIGVDGPMLAFHGNGDRATLDFYNCCFSHDIAGASDYEGPLYLDLTGYGTVTFKLGVCFDVSSQERALRKEDSVVVKLDSGVENVYGDCQCNVSISEPSHESLVTDPPTPPPTPVPEAAKSVSVGLITGVFFGLLILIILLALLILFLLWRRRREKSSTEEEAPRDEVPEETITSLNDHEGVDDNFDAHTNDNPLFATELTTNDVFNNEFEEKGSFFMDGTTD